MAKFYETLGKKSQETRGTKNKWTSSRLA